MANLRADNLTGTGGRNALDGSVAFLGDKDALQVPAGSDFAYGTGDFTIETWIRPQGVTSGESKGIFTQTQSGNEYVKFFINSDKTIKATFGSDTITGGMVEVGSWSHVAVTRASNTVKVFVNGVASSGTSVTTDFTDTTRKPTIGQYTHSFGTLEYYGYISNFRIVKGTAVYTTDFTPPTEKLTAIAGTVLLCCQDSDDATQEATGKTITGYGNLNKVTTDVNLVTNGHFTTDISGWTVVQGAAQWTAGQAELTSPATTMRQTLTTVVGQRYRMEGTADSTGNTSNNIGITLGSRLAYQASDSFRPAAKTFTADWTATSTSTVAEFWGGTDGTGKWSNIIVKLAEQPKVPKVIPSVGIDEGVTFGGETKHNTQGHMYFPTGDTSQRGRGRGVVCGNTVPAITKVIDYFTIQTGGTALEFGDASVAGQHTACSSTTRGVFAMGSLNNTIDYVTISTTGNTIDFGDRTVALNGPGGLSNDTRGVFVGGGSPNPQSDVMDYITIATTGNATDFGNMSTGNKNPAGLASPTRGVIAHGGDPFTNVIDYITIASTGNATDFGDTTNNAEGYMACASNIRGIFSGGIVSPANVNTIQYVTIATTGNATDFGDIGSNRVTSQSGAGTSNNLRGVTMGGRGYAPGSQNTISKTMEYVNIATTGNSFDFGFLANARVYCGSCSDSHGGLS